MKHGKKFLERANNIESKIDATLRKVELYKSLTQRVSAKLNRDRVSQSSDVTANEKAIIRLMDEEERLKQLYDEYEKIVDEITAVLTKLEDPNDERLLVELYLENQTIHSLAAREHVTRAGIYKRLERALEEIETLLTQ